MFGAIGPPVLALMAALGVDRLTQNRGLLPPYFVLSQSLGQARDLPALVRRTVALSVLTLVLWVGVFAPLGAIGSTAEVDLSRLSRFDLFLLHLLLVLCLVVWYVAGFLPLAERSGEEDAGWRAQFGLRARSIGRELGLGIAIGVAAWLVVLGVLVATAVTVWWLGGESLLPQEPPPLIPWIAALPLTLRLAISLSAGVVEETFFRGFLQPRVGLSVSTILFVLAHASYEQPFMLIGVGLLSLIYGGLVVWRRSIWAAIAAHTFFDAVQLTVVIPAALDALPTQTGSTGLAELVFGLI